MDNAPESQVRRRVEPPHVAIPSSDHNSSADEFVFLVSFGRLRYGLLISWAGIIRRSREMKHPEGRPIERTVIARFQKLEVIRELPDMSGAARSKLQVLRQLWGTGSAGNPGRLVLRARP
jgi:hypothetical protein